MLRIQGSSGEGDQSGSSGSRVSGGGDQPGCSGSRVSVGEGDAAWVSPVGTWLEGQNSTQSEGAFWCAWNTPPPLHQVPRETCRTCSRDLLQFAISASKIHTILTFAGWSINSGGRQRQLRAIMRGTVRLVQCNLKQQCPNETDRVSATLTELHPALVVLHPRDAPSQGGGGLCNSHTPGEHKILRRRH